MAEEQRLDDRVDKRKCDDFTSLYSLEPTVTSGGPVSQRGMPDPSGKFLSLLYLKSAPQPAEFSKEMRKFSTRHPLTRSPKPDPNAKSYFTSIIDLIFQRLCSGDEISRIAPVNSNQIPIIYFWPTNSISKLSP